MGDFIGEMVKFKGQTRGGGGLSHWFPHGGNRIRTQISQCVHVSMVPADILVKHGKGGGWRETG